MYRAKFWRGKLWQIDRFRGNVGEFTMANFSESGIWLGKILVNDACFAKFAKVFPARVLHYMVVGLIYILTCIDARLLANTCALC